VKGKRGLSERQAKQKMDWQRQNLHEFARKSGLASGKLHVFDTMFLCVNLHRREGVFVKKDCGEKK
jgi:hypothetical protein